MENTRLRVIRACDICRQKKAKCNGAHACDRCTEAGMICTYNSEGKHYKMTKEALYMQQNQWLKESLKLLYEYVQTLPASSIQNTGNQSPSVHDIVAHINGVLRKDGINGENVHNLFDEFNTSYMDFPSEFIPYTSTESVMVGHNLWAMANTDRPENVNLQLYPGHGDGMYINTRTEHSS